MTTLRQWFAIFLSFCLVYSQVFFNLAYAQGIETDGTTQTTLDKARNGVTIVNIAKPSSRGLSHNKFKKYNVNKQGVILNNANQSAVKTQLGGYIYGNQHLSAGSAKVILNEVTSSSRSFLNGFTEVAGQSADLVLVNPNGISMNGAGFINIPNITFSTGQANIDSGQIDSFSVNRGDILIEGDGLNTKTQQATYIYTKSLQLNAKIHAQDLNVTLGSNEIDYQTKQATAQSTTPAQPDQVMLDSSALGGMYANRITLVGTDKGVGVNLPPEVLASTGDITITAGGKIQLNDLAAKTDINVTSTDNDITLQGTTHSGNATHLDAKTDIITNTNTTIASENEIHLTSGNAFTNQGTLMAGINSDGSANYTGTIKLHNTQLINRNKIATGTLTGTNITNESEIVSRTINANTLTNNDKLTTQDNLTINATTLTNNAGISAANTLTTNTTDLDNYQTLFSGGDMNLYTTGTLKNHENANIFALENITLAGDNAGGKSNQIINNQATIETYNGDMVIKSEELQNTINDKPIKTSSTTSSFAQLNYTKACRLHDGQSGSCNNHSWYYLTDKWTWITTESITHKPAPSKILSGHNLTIDSNNITNKYSLIAANNDLQVNTQNLINVSEEALKTTTVRTKNYYVKYDESCSGDGPSDRHCTSYPSGRMLQSDSTVPYIQVLDGVYATIQAGGNVTIIGDTIDNKHKRTGIALTGRTEQAGDTPSSTPDIPVPHGNHGLFVVSDDPNSNYLIESNPEFTLYQNFISSDYMMNHLDIDPAATTKRIGDAFYENKLVRDSIFKQTGRRFLNKSLKNDYDQFKYLMENALNASKDLKLIAGISLSQEQINSLTSDIVWMEEKIVRGHRVLVPVVYLANRNHYTIADGAKIIAGESVNLQVANLVNTGTVEAGDNLSIVATDAITNLGGQLTAEQDMKLHARTDIRNTSGTIDAENITIKSDEGSFIHETHTEQVSYSNISTQVDTNTIIGKTAELNASGNLTIDTGKDIIVKGADITARDTSLTASNLTIETIQNKHFFSEGGRNSSGTRHIGSNLTVADLDINAENKVRIAGSNVSAKDTSIKAKNVVIETAKNESSSKRSGFFSKTESNSTTHVGSSLNVANLNIDAKEDVRIAGSNIKADQMAVSAENINIETVQNKTYDRQGSKKYSTTTHQGSSIEVASLDMKAANRAKIEGSSITAQDKLRVQANQIDVLSVNDTTYYKKKSSSKGLFSSKSSSKERFTSKNKASTLSAANMELVTTAGDINVVGSNLQATENLSLDAGNNLNIQAGHDGYFYEKKTKEGGLFRNGDFYSEEENLEGKMTKTAVASNINAANVSLKSNREILVEGSNLSGGSITGEAENITVKGAENIEKTWSKTTKKSMGFGDLKNSLTRPDKVISTKDKKLTAKIADAQYENVDTSTKKTTVASSNLDGNNITLTANSEEEFEGNILIEGSNLNASESISLTASNDVSVIEAKETTETKSSSKKGKAELKVGVKHQAVEVLKAVEALQLAQKTAEQAKDAYDDFKDQLKQAEKLYKDGLIEKEDLDDVRDDARFYKANVVLTAAAVVSATQALTGQIIASTQSSGTYGFNAEVQLDIDALVEKAKEITTRSVGSNLNANTIEINAGNRAQVRGSNLNANEQIAIDAKEVEISASRDTNEATSSTDHAHLTVNYSVYGGLSANATADFSQSSSKGTTYNNARLNSKNISITSKEDTYVTGAVVKADENLDLDVGGNLKVASLQDRSRSKSNSIGVSASYSKSSNQKAKTTTESQSAGFNMSSSRGKKKWVTEQTALLGGKVNIKVDNHTDLKGAKIAAVDENGNDTGNLLLQTKSLSYEDIRNKDQNNNMSLSATVSHSVTEGGPQAKGNEDKKPGEPESPFSQSGSVGMGFSDRSSITKATIGLGTIIVNNETDPILKNLNRKIDNANVDIKNTGTQMSLDDATLNVLLNPVETAEKTVEDSIHAAMLGVALGGMTINALDKKSTLKKGLDSIVHGFDIVNGVAVVAKDEESDQHQRLKNTENASAEEIEQLGNEVFHENQVIIGIDAEDTSTIMLTSRDGIKDGRIREWAAATDEGNGQSYLNVQQTDITDGGDILGSLWAETTRQKYDREYDKLPAGSYRNDEFETGVEKVGIFLAKGTWSMISGEKAAKPVERTVNGKTTTFSARDAWYEKNKDSSRIAAGNKKLNAAKDKSKVKPREVRLSEARKLDNLKEVINARTDISEQQKKVTEYAINALACAKVKCAKGVPEDDVNYAKLKALQDQGDTLISDGHDLGKIMENYGQKLDEGDFEYNRFTDGAMDWITENDEVLKKAAGAAKMTAGAIQTGVSGAATVVSIPACVATGVACVATGLAGANTTMSAMDTKEGYDQVTEEYVSTEGDHVMKSFSMKTRDFGDRNLVKDVAVDASFLALELVAGKKLDMVMDAGGKKLKKKLKDKFETAAGKAYDASKTKRITHMNVGESIDDVVKRVDKANEGFVAPKLDIDESDIKLLANTAENSTNGSIPSWERKALNESAKKNKGSASAKIDVGADGIPQQANNAVDDFSLPKGNDETVTWYHGSLDKPKVESEGFSVKNDYGQDRKSPYVCVSTDCKAAQNAIDPRVRYQAQYTDPNKAGIIKGEMSKSEWDKLHQNGDLTTEDYKYGFSGEKINSTETKARTPEGVEALNQSIKDKTTIKQTRASEPNFKTKTDSNNSYSSANEKYPTPIFKKTEKPKNEGATPNSIYVQTTENVPNKKVKRVAYYDENGKQFAREDYIQNASHKVVINEKTYNLKNYPHEHQERLVTNESGQTFKKKQVRIIDEKGKPKTEWVNERQK